MKIIGISGISGSGKTTLTHLLAKELNATSIFWDDYDEISEGPDNYVKWFENSRNYNDWKYDVLADVLESLHEEKTAICPATKRELMPTKYVVFDAPLGYEHQATGQQIDFLIFLDTPLDIALARRLIRDYQTGPALNADMILNELKSYLASTRPLYVEGSKKRGDLILDGSLPVELNLPLVLSSLKDLTP